MTTAARAMPKARAPKPEKRPPEGFPGSTQIELVRGRIRMDEVRVGDEIIMGDGSRAPVTDTHRRKGRTVLVTGHGHPGIELSAQHPVLVRDKRGNGEPKWIGAEALDPRHHEWAMPASIDALPIPEGSPNVMSGGWSIVGHYLRDGWIDGSRVSIHAADPREVDRMRTLVSDANPRWREEPQANGKGSVFVTHNSPMAKWMSGNFGDSPKTKTIPVWTVSESLPTQTRQALLDAYIGPDWKPPPTTSRSLWPGAAMLAAGLGHYVDVNHRLAAISPTWQMERLPNDGHHDGTHSWHAIRRVKKLRSRTLHDIEVGKGGGGAFIVDGHAAAAYGEKPPEDKPQAKPSKAKPPTNPSGGGGGGSFAAARPATRRFRGAAGSVLGLPSAIGTVVPSLPRRPRKPSPQGNHDRTTAEARRRTPQPAAVPPARRGWAGLEDQVDARTQARRRAAGSLPAHVAAAQAATAQSTAAQQRINAAASPQARAIAAQAERALNVNGVSASELEAMRRIDEQNKKPHGTTASGVASRLNLVPRSVDDVMRSPDAQVDRAELARVEAGEAPSRPNEVSHTVANSWDHSGDDHLRAHGRWNGEQGPREMEILDPELHRRTLAVERAGNWEREHGSLEITREDADVIDRIDGKPPGTTYAAALRSQGRLVAVDDPNELLRTPAEREERATRMASAEQEHAPPVRPRIASPDASPIIREPSMTAADAAAQARWEALPADVRDRINQGFKPNGAAGLPTYAGDGVIIDRSLLGDVPAPQRETDTVEANRGVDWQQPVDHHTGRTQAQARAGTTPTPVYPGLNVSAEARAAIDSYARDLIEQSAPHRAATLEVWAQDYEARNGHTPSPQERDVALAQMEAVAAGQVRQIHGTYMAEASLPRATRGLTPQEADALVQSVMPDVRVVHHPAEEAPVAGAQGRADVEDRTIHFYGVVGAGYLSHELAHIALGNGERKGTHGPAFRAAHLAMTERIYGPAARGELAAAYDATGLAASTRNDSRAAAGAVETARAVDATPHTAEAVPQPAVAPPAADSVDWGHFDRAMSGKELMPKDRGQLVPANGGAGAAAANRNASAPTAPAAPAGTGRHETTPLLEGAPQLPEFPAQRAVTPRPSEAARNAETARLHALARPTFYRMAETRATAMHHHLGKMPEAERAAAAPKEVERYQQTLRDDWERTVGPGVEMPRIPRRLLGDLEQHLPAHPQARIDPPTTALQTRQPAVDIKQRTQDEWSKIVDTQRQIDEASRQQGHPEDVISRTSARHLDEKWAQGGFRATAGERPTNGDQIQWARAKPFKPTAEPERERWSTRVPESTGDHDLRNSHKPRTITDRSDDATEERKPKPKPEDGPREDGSEGANDRTHKPDLGEASTNAPDDTRKEPVRAQEKEEEPDRAATNQPEHRKEPKAAPDAQRQSNDRGGDAEAGKKPATPAPDSQPAKAAELASSEPPWRTRSHGSDSTSSVTPAEPSVSPGRGGME